MHGIVRDPVRHAGKGGTSQMQSRLRKFRANQRCHRATKLEGLSWRYFMRRAAHGRAAHLNAAPGPRS